MKYASPSNYHSLTHGLYSPADMDVPKCMKSFAHAVKAMSGMEKQPTVIHLSELLGH